MVAGKKMFLDYSKGMSYCRTCAEVYVEGRYKCVYCGKKCRQKPNYGGEKRVKYMKVKGVRIG